MVEEDDRARQIIRRLMRLAHRRPVTEGDLTVPFRFYEETKRRERFDSGIEMALRAILTSVDFLFRIELDPPEHSGGAVYAIDDLQLATRLSFFL